jgi:hypothetical protein
MALRRRTFGSTRGQQATPNNTNPKPAIRAMTVVAPETFVPSKGITMLGAITNASPVSASSVDAAASSTFATSYDYLQWCIRSNESAACQAR